LPPPLENYANKLGIYYVMPAMSTAGCTWGIAFPAVGVARSRIPAAGGQVAVTADERTGCLLAWPNFWTLAAESFDHRSITSIIPINKINALSFGNFFEGL